MSITTIQPTQMGGHASHYLSVAPRLGNIISTFRHGSNVLFDEETVPTFITLQTHHIPLHPWAIETSNLAVQQVGSNVLTESKRPQLQIGETIVDLSQVPTHALKIEPWCKDGIAHAQNHISMVEGLLAKELTSRVPDPFQPEINAILECWRHRGNTDELLGLIGLGIGSTPSGDDLVVGLLAAFAALGRMSLSESLRATDIRQKTHPVSAQMIKAAMNGSFSLSLLDLANFLGQETSTEAQIQQCVKTVAGQGATSGAAMLKGFHAALIAQFKT